MSTRSSDTGTRHRDPTRGPAATARAAPQRPPMDPIGGVRHLTLRPHEMTADVTATGDLFVIAHMGVPRVDPAAWSLTVDGMVGRPVSLDLADLKARPKRVVEAVHHCAGSPLAPTVPTHRAANLRWGGADLAELLAAVGVEPGASFLWSYGLDGGEFAGAACEWYLKDLPLARVAAGDVLLAWELNGEPLRPEHGAPVRLVVPGYYGTNSVKWLWRLHLANRRAEGRFTTELYNDAAGPSEIAAGLPAWRPVWAMAPHAIVVSPAPDAVVAVGETVEIAGRAWSSDGIASVEVSVDGGASYQCASLEPRRGWAWQRFRLPWRPAERGEALIAARASEAGGTAQPHDGARNAIHTVRVAVR